MRAHRFAIFQTGRPLAREVLIEVQRDRNPMRTKLRPITAHLHNRNTQMNARADGLTYGKTPLM